MKKFNLFLLFVFTGISLSAQSDYVFSGSSSDGGMYVYFNKSIRKNTELKNTYYVWTKEFYFGKQKSDEIDYLKGQKDLGEIVTDFDSLKYGKKLVLINTAIHKYKTLSMSFYSNTNNIYSYDFNESQEGWKYSVPESMMDELITKVQKYLMRKN
jgi:hypothetical protein